MDTESLFEVNKVYLQKDVVTQWKNKLYYFR